MSEWLKWMLIGGLSIIAGIIVLGNVVAASAAVTIVTGVMFMLAGGFQVVAAVAAEGVGRTVIGVLIGALMAFLGVSFMSNPLEGMISLTSLVMIMLAASGILRIWFAFRMREEMTFFWVEIVSGGLSVVLAIWVYANFLTATQILLGTMLGIELLLNGVGLVVFALFIRKVGDTIKNAA